MKWCYDYVSQKILWEKSLHNRQEVGLIVQQSKRKERFINNPLLSFIKRYYYKDKINEPVTH